MIPLDSPSILSNPVALGHKRIRGPFVIPSGIRCTRGSTISWCFANVPSIGVITTKSISLAPRAGYREPIYARYATDSYINAVGLSNPGAEQFRRELLAIQVPPDKFLLVSIFGGDAKDFVQTALVLRDVADGFEMNMSCPHAKGYGVEIGQNRDLVAEITGAVKLATGLPVLVKLSAVVGDVGLIAKAAIQAGAAGITVSNTVGPGMVCLGDAPILSNRVGGLSGTAIKPLALRGVQRVREAIGPGPVIIGMGGISTPADILQFRSAGADLLGIGSALTGMDSEKMRLFFSGLGNAFSGISTSTPEEISMTYTPTRLIERISFGPGLFKLRLDGLPSPGSKGKLAGQYFFLFVPEAGEKPFAVFSAEERSILVKVVGKFTRYLEQAPIGSTIYLRGPYGRELPRFNKPAVVLVGGGTGIASLYEVGRRLEGKHELQFLLGGRSSRDLVDLPQFAQMGEVRTSTDDGSQGCRGFVSDLLAEWLGHCPHPREATYIICGPEPMVQKCFMLLQPCADPDEVWGAIEYMTSCGVGICGKCASPSGLLTCIDGPFLPMAAFQSRPAHRGCKHPASCPA